MSGISDTFNRVREKLSSFLKDKKEEAVNRAELKKRKYNTQRKLRKYKRLARESRDNQVKMYLKYAVFEFAPYILIYGLMANFPMHVLLGMALTWKTVVSYGLVFYFVDEELVSIANELKPYIRVSAKVDK